MPSAASRTWFVTFCRSSDLRLGQVSLPSPVCSAFSGHVPNGELSLTSSGHHAYSGGYRPGFSPDSLVQPPESSSAATKSYILFWHKKTVFPLRKDRMDTKQPTTPKRVLPDVRSLPADVSRRTRPFAPDSHRLMIKSTCVTQVSHRICLIFTLYFFSIPQSFADCKYNYIPVQHKTNKLTCFDFYHAYDINNGRKPSCCGLRLFPHLKHLGQTPQGFSQSVILGLISRCPCEE